MNQPSAERRSELLGENLVSPNIGGQAVIEGVMIRSPKYITVAVRKKDGSIILQETPFRSLTEKFRLPKLPIVRGMVNLVEMMVAGMKALNFSAEQYADDHEPGEKKPPEPKPRWFQAAAFAFSLAISLGLAIFLFKFIPLAVTTFLTSAWPALEKYVLLFNLVDGLIRIAIFFLYLVMLSCFKTFQRVFQYHGAEHQSIFAYEKNQPLDVEHVRRESPRHPRCGTSFIVIVLIISILLLSLVPKHPVLYIHLLRRLAIIPLIAGVAYELLKWTAKHRNRRLVAALTYPGILTQYITTKKPDDQQIEVAMAALKKALELEKGDPETSLP